MGIDFLDLTFSLEKKHRLCVILGKKGIDAFLAVQSDAGKGWLGNQRRDWNVGDFYQCLNHLYTLCPQCKKVPKNGWQNTTCPKCHVPLTPGSLTFEKFSAILQEIVGKKKVITRDKWMRIDLEFS
jgi:hypothetical protein